jgi:ATP-dependent Clp protease adaptor protein ClpS
MKPAALFFAVCTLASVDALVHLSPTARPSVRPIVARSAVAMADVLTRPPDVKLAPQQPSSDQQNARGKKFKLLLFNDSVNKREFVARVLTGTIPEMTEATAYTVMQKAHTAGFAVCGIWTFELAEAYCDGLTVRASRASRASRCGEPCPRHALR